MLKFWGASSSQQPSAQVEAGEQRENANVDETIKVYVRYAQGAKNPVPIDCAREDTVYELAGKLKVNAHKFKLTDDDFDESEVDLYTVGTNDKKTNLHPSVKISTLIGSKVEFDTGNFVVYVGHISQTSEEMFNCREKNTVYDLICKLRERLHEFGLPPADVERVWLNEGRLQIYKKAKLPGGVNTPLVLSQRLDEMKGETLLFDMISRSVDIECISKKCCGQNIIFFGGPSHGKSSTINTIVKSMQGFHQNLAQTFTAVMAGTTVYTPYRIDVKSKSFTLWDVPGTSLSSKISRHATDGRRVIQNILDGKLPAHSAIDGPFRSSGLEADKIHAAVCVQKGTAELERLHSMVFEATRRHGRSMPVFFIITHQDQMEDHEVEDKINEVSGTFGVDKSAIFTIANYDHTTLYNDDPQRDAHVLSALWQMLSCAYTYKTRGRVQIGESVGPYDIEDRIEQTEPRTEPAPAPERPQPRPARHRVEFCVIS